MLREYQVPYLRDNKL